MSETKTLHRNFWVWEFEKEERWLNEMAQEGWALQNAGFCTYTFEKTEPGQYIIRLAMLDSSPDFESFMEELEAQSVGHCFSWGYFRRSAQLGPFDMFSDVDSRISHLNKIGQMVRLLCLANLLIAFSTLETEFSTRQSPVSNPSVAAERKSMKPSNTLHKSAGEPSALTGDTSFGGTHPLKKRLRISYPPATFGKPTAKYRLPRTP